jgi:hypothetical protein
VKLAFRAALLTITLALPACTGDRNFTILGYTTQPNYDANIRTVRVPIFKNLTLRRGLEFDLTRAVVREIELKTPWKVVGPNCDADTELTGTIINYQKNIVNRNQLNEIREAETTLAVEVVWRDLRTGEILTRPRRPAVNPVVPELAPPDMRSGPGPSAIALPPTEQSPAAPLPPLGGPPLPPPPPPPPPVLVQSIAGFIPELGESLTTAYKRNVDRLAVNIVSMMEKPW